MVSAEGGKLGSVEEHLEDLVAKFGREGEEGWGHGRLEAARCLIGDCK